MIGNEFRVLCIVLVSMFVLSSCFEQESEQDILKRDARSFCEIHDEKHWQDVSKELSMVEFNKISKIRITKAVKTDAFRHLIDEMEEVEFYRQMYPTAQEKIEALTGATWDCPQYEKFYRVYTSKLESDAEVNTDIFITHAGQYWYQGKPLSLGVESLKMVLEKSNHKKLMIELEAGASEEFLVPLFKALSDLGVEDISVISK